jgi:hypothetical protein
MLHNIFKDHSKEELIATFHRMDKIYARMAWNDPARARYTAKFEAFMLYLHTRLTNKDFLELFKTNK